MTSSPISCDVTSRTWSERVKHGDDVWKSSFLAPFMDSLCCVRNKIMYVLLWRTVYALTRLLFWCLFPSLLRNSGNKHQNNPLVSAETVRHASTYIILYVTWWTSHVTYQIYQLKQELWCSFYIDVYNILNWNISESMNQLIKYLFYLNDNSTKAMYCNVFYHYFKSIYST